MMARDWGVDLHRTSFVTCVRGADGGYERRTWPMGRVDDWLAPVSPADRVAVEAMGSTRWFYEAVKDRVSRVVVVNPVQFKVISQSVKKTDARDAQLLCEYLSRDMLPEVRMKDKVQAQIASLTQTRDKLVQLRTTLKNKISSLLADHGVVLAGESLSSDRGLEGVLAHRFDAMVMIELKVLVDQIRGGTGASESWKQRSRPRVRNCRGTRTSRASRGLVRCRHRFF